VDSAVWKKGKKRGTQAKMVERRLTRRDQAGLSQPDRTGLLASADGARDTHATRETTTAGASFFAFLSHIARSQHKGRISHKALMGLKTRPAMLHNQRRHSSHDKGLEIFLCKETNAGH